MSPIRIREPTPPFFGSTASAICSLLIAPSSRIANIAVLAQRDLARPEGKGSAGVRAEHACPRL